MRTKFTAISDTIVDVHFYNGTSKQYQIWHYFITDENEEFVCSGLQYTGKRLHFFKGDRMIDIIRREYRKAKRAKLI